MLLNRFKIQAGALLSLLLGVGCISVFNSQPAASGVDFTRERFVKSPVKAVYSETLIHGEDGVQGAQVAHLMNQVGDLINRSFLDGLRASREKAASFLLKVPPVEAFSAPMTLPASPLLSPKGAMIAMWAAEDGDAGEEAVWRLGARHNAAFHVFNDTVELQLVSVVTIVDGRGQTVWQASARSRKLFDAWETGEHLASLTAHFVMTATRENVDSIVSHAAFRR